MSASLFTLSRVHRHSTQTQGTTAFLSYRLLDSIENSHSDADSPKPSLHSTLDDIWALFHTAVWAQVFHYTPRALSSLEKMEQNQLNSVGYRNRDGLIYEVIHPDSFVRPVNIGLVLMPWRRILYEMNHFVRKLDNSAADGRKLDILPEMRRVLLRGMRDFGEVVEDLKCREESYQKEKKERLEKDKLSK